MYMKLCVNMDIWYGLWWHKILMEPPFLIWNSYAHSVLTVTEHFFHTDDLLLFYEKKWNEKLNKCIKNAANGKFSTFSSSQVHAMCKNGSLPSTSKKGHFSQSTHYSTCIMHVCFHLTSRFFWFRKNFILSLLRILLNVE